MPAAQKFSYPMDVKKKDSMRRTLRALGERSMINIMHEMVVSEVIDIDKAPGVRI